MSLRVGTRVRCDFYDDRPGTIVGITYHVKLDAKRGLSTSEPCKCEPGDITAYRNQWCGQDCFCTSGCDHWDEPIDPRDDRASTPQGLSEEGADD